MNRYPDLIGLGIEVTMTPEFDTTIATHVNGAETSTSFREFPQWKFDLSYEYLPSTLSRPHLQRIQGLYLQSRGKWGKFLFSAPEFSFSDGVEIGVGDGSETGFTLLREVDGYREPVGAWDPNSVGEEFTINGVLVPRTAYSIAGNKVVFTLAPAAGAVIRASFSYCFVCRFDSDGLSFNRFAWELWEAKTVALKSKL